MPAKPPLPMPGSRLCALTSRKETGLKVMPHQGTRSLRRSRSNFRLDAVARRKSDLYGGG